MDLRNFSANKFLALFGAIMIATFGIGGAAYYKYGVKDEAPPYLTVNTSAYMQGKLSKINGFAELKNAASCSANSITLEKNVNHVYSTKPVTMKEISDALRFSGKDGQYLIAFFTPGDEKAIDQDSKFKNDKNVYYVYPTSKAPFNNVKSLKSGSSYGDKLIIPAYRGFQIIVNNDATKVCGDHFRASNDGNGIFDANDGSENLSIMRNGLKYWPQGWVMVPFGIGIDLSGFIDQGRVVDFIVSSVYLQKNRSEFSDDLRPTGYSMVWMKLDKVFDWVNYIDSNSNSDTYVSSTEPEIVEYDSNNNVSLTELESFEYDEMNGLVTIRFTNDLLIDNGLNIATFIFQDPSLQFYEISVSSYPGEARSVLTFAIPDYQNKVGTNTFNGWYNNLKDQNGEVVSQLTQFLTFQIVSVGEGNNIPENSEGTDSNTDESDPDDVASGAQTESDPNTDESDLDDVASGAETESEDN